METVKEFTLLSIFKLHKTQHGGEVDTKSHLKLRRYSQIISAGTGENSFLHWGDTRYFNHILRQTSFSEVVGQHKLDFMF